MRKHTTHIIAAAVAGSLATFGATWAIAHGAEPDVVTVTRTVDADEDTTRMVDADWEASTDEQRAQVCSGLRNPLLVGTGIDAYVQAEREQGHDPRPGAVLDRFLELCDAAGVGA